MVRLPKVGTDVKKGKLGTTVLESTLNGLKDLQARRPDDVRSTGEAIDLICGLMLGVEPQAAKELMDFCSGRAEHYAKRLGAFSVEEADGYSFSRESRIHGTFSGLADYFKGYCAENANEVSGMKRIDLKGGDYLVCPDTWPILNEDAAQECSNVVVIEIRGGDKYGAPHLIYLKPEQGWITDEEKAEALRLAVLVWPDMKKVLHDEVPLVCDAEGRPLNEMEHLSAPIVCYFNIMDASDFRRPSDAPYGAMVFRK